MSDSIQRRWRALAAAVALCAGSLAMPAAALADGTLDPSFNGSGYHLGSADGFVLADGATRLPVVVQADGRIVVGGQSSDGYMTLIRYNADGSLDTSFGSGGFAKRQFAGTPTSGVGSSGAVAMTPAANGDIIVAGFGASQAEIVARFSAGGVYIASTVCYAPHLIDYTARALAIRPDGSIVIAGFARDRHAATTMYGQRAVVTLPAGGNSTTACGAYGADPVTHHSFGSAGVVIDGLNHDGSGADPARAGRWYDGVVALPDNRYVVASTSGPDSASWVQRYGADGAPDTTFNGGRVTLPGINLHALTLLGDGSVLAAGETGAQIAVARIDAGGALGGFGSGGIASVPVGTGGAMGQAIAVQADGKVLVGGGATIGGKTGLALVRLTAAGALDDSFADAGRSLVPLAAGNGYLTGMALSGPTLAVAGRAGDTGSRTSLAGRYYVNGTAPPVPAAVPAAPAAVAAPPAVAPARPAAIAAKAVKKAAKRLCVVPRVKGTKLRRARAAVVAHGCKLKVRFVASKKARNTVLAQSRKAGRRLGFRAVVKLTVAKRAVARAQKRA